mgnify:CR=1 FL=1
MKDIYNDLLSAYYEMKNKKISICNNINDLLAKREQLEENITRIETILEKYGTYQGGRFIENKSSDNGNVETESEV